MGDLFSNQIWHVSVCIVNCVRFIVELTFNCNMPIFINAFFKQLWLIKNYFLRILEFLHCFHVPGSDHFVCTFIFMNKI